jgi:hypothetical protein
VERPRARRPLGSLVRGEGLDGHGASGSAGTGLSLLPAAGVDHKFAVFGALDYAAGRVISRLSPREDSEAFVAFLEQLRNAFPEEKLVVVLDNVGYHKSHRSLVWWRRWQSQLCPFCSWPIPWS